MAAALGGAAFLVAGVLLTGVFFGGMVELLLSLGGVSLLCDDVSLLGDVGGVSSSTSSTSPRDIISSPTRKKGM